MYDIKAVAGGMWIRTDNNGEKWKKLEEAFANKWHTDKISVAQYIYREGRT